MGSVYVSSCRCCEFVSVVLQLLDPLIKINKKGIIVVTFSHHHESTAPLFHNLKILNFKKLVTQKIAQLVSALDLVTSSVQVEGSILTAGKRLSLKNLNVIIRAIN